MRMVLVVLQNVSWYYADDLATVVGTGSSYVLSASDVGKQMYFEVSFTDDDGFWSLLSTIAECAELRSKHSC